MSLILQILAILSAGIAVTSLFLLFFELLSKIELSESANVEIAEDLRKIPLMIKLCLPLTPNFMKIVRLPVLDGIRRNSQDMLMQAGLDQVLHADQYMATRLMLGGIGLILALLMSVRGAPFIGFAIWLMLLIYPWLWLKNLRDRRHLSIQKALPNLLDLLTLSVEAGKDFLSSLRDILRRRKIDPLGEELTRTFQEIQLGKSRRDALKELSSRVQQHDLTAVLNAIVQADELGVSIGQILRIQGDQLRTKRFQRAEKLANEAPIKILIPVVLFIFPAVFLILLAPLLLQLFNTIK